MIDAGEQGPEVLTPGKKCQGGYSVAKYWQNPGALGNQMSRGTINILLRKLNSLSQDVHLY